MASWKKIITSGSKADLNEVTASGGIKGTIQTAAQGSITSLGTLTSLAVDNISLDSNTITTTDTNGSLTITPNGTGDINLGGDTIKIGDQNTDAVLTTWGTGDLTLSTNEGTNSGTIVIADAANGNISLTPNGTGAVVLSKVDIASGEIDGTVIGGTTKAAGSFTKIINNDLTSQISGSFTGSFTGDGSNLTGIAAFLSMSADSGTADGVNLKTDTLRFAGDGDVNTAVSDNSMSISLDTDLEGVETIYNTALKIGRASGDTYIDFGTADDNIDFYAGATKIIDLTTAGIDVTGKLTTTTSVEPTTFVKAGTYLSGSNVSGSGHLGIGGGGVINGSLGTYTGADGSTRNIGLHVENDISASGFKGEFFEITSSVLITSESTTFGNDATDTHNFSGSIVTHGGANSSVDFTDSTSGVSGSFSGSFVGLGTDLDLSANTTIGSEIFKTIVVAGQSNVVAQNNADELTLASSSDGLKITTSGETITFDLDSIPNASLANSTISGKALGTNLAGLTVASNGGLTLSGTYNGSTARTIKQNISDLADGGDVIAISDSFAFDDGGTTKKSTISQSVAPVVGRGLEQGVSGHISASYGTTAGNAVEGGSTITFAGTSNEITIDNGGTQTLGANGTVTYGLADTIGGNRTFSGDISIQGNTTLGDANSDTVTINADLASNIIPDGDGTRNLGEDSTRFANVYTDALAVTNDITIGGNLNVLGTQTSIDVETVRVEDNFILLNSGSATDTQIDSGITIKQTDSIFQNLFYDADNTRFAIHKTTGEVTTNGTLVPDNYITTVSASTSAPSAAPEYGNGVKRGEMVVQDNGDIWIYTD